MDSHFPVGELEYQLAEMLRKQIVNYIVETRTDEEWMTIEHKLDMSRASIEVMIDSLHGQMKLSFRVAEHLGIIRQVISEPKQITLITSIDHGQLSFEFDDSAGLVA